MGKIDVAITEKGPRDTDQFLVDVSRGRSYHLAGCPATTYPLADYTELSYGEVRAIKTHNGELFEPHRCVRGQVNG